MASYENFYRTMKNKHHTPYDEYQDQEQEMPENLNNVFYDNCFDEFDSERDWCKNFNDFNDEDAGLDHLYDSLDGDTMIEHFFYQGSDSLMMRENSNGDYLIIASEICEDEEPSISVHLTEDQIIELCEHGTTQKSNIEDSSSYITKVGPYVAIIDVANNKCFTFTDTCLGFLCDNL